MIFLLSFCIALDARELGLLLLLFENECARLFIDLAELCVFLFTLFLCLFDYLIYLCKLNGDLLRNIKDIVNALLDIGLSLFGLSDVGGTLTLGIDLILIHI